MRGTLQHWKTPQARHRSLMALADNVATGRSKRWLGRQSHGEHCHPLVNVLVDAINEEKISFNALGLRAGLKGETIRKWRTARNPSLTDFEAALNALGLELRIVKRSERKLA